MQTACIYTTCICIATCSSQQYAHGRVYKDTERVMGELFLFLSKANLQQLSIGRKQQRCAEMVKWELSLDWVH